MDVFCHPKAVIEVQLSGETAHSMEARTTRYGGSVTWLFGAGGHITSRDARSWPKLVWFSWCGYALTVTRSSPTCEVAAAADVAGADARRRWPCWWCGLVPAGRLHIPSGERARSANVRGGAGACPGGPGGACRR